MESWIQDVRFGVRLFWKNKSFAAAAILTLTLCIGANSAIFSILHSVVLKPLPVPESDRILLMYNSYPNAGVEKSSTGVPDYFDRLRDLTVFEEQALYDFNGITIGGERSAERTLSLAVTPSFFRLLRTKPGLGRIFTEEEGEPGKDTKVILSHGLWHQRFGGDPSVLGRDLRINGRPFTIVGVMPVDFLFLDPEVRLWTPLAFTPEQKSDEMRHSQSWEMIGRLKPDATIEKAQAQVDALNAANMERFPQFTEILRNAEFRTRVVGLRDEMIRDIRGTLYLLWGGVFFLLLIGSVNIANLMMARGLARRKELAMRFALGAAHWRVTRQLLTEAALLTIASAIGGLALGYFGLRTLRLLGLEEIPRGSEIAMDGTVVIFILGLALIIGIVIGAVPVGHAFSLNTSRVLHEEGGAGTGGRGARLVRSSLATAQVALALMLLVGAGLLFASFRKVLAINPGFDTRQVVTGSLSLPSYRYKNDAERRVFTSRLLESIQSLPGVLAAGVTDTIPLGNSSSSSVMLAEGYQMKPGESLVSPSNIVVSAGHFQALRIPLIAGRFFENSDREDSQRVIIVDERLARKFWPGISPVGKRMWRPTSTQNLIKPDDKVQWFTVVGVVGSVKLRALVDPDERVGACYFPYTQRPTSTMTIAVRATGEPTSLVSAVRARIGELDAEIPFYDVKTMQERLDGSLVSRRSPMLLALGFSVVALFLAALGIYGVLAYLVAQRTREIGIRMALGSSTGKILHLVLREGMFILGAGFTIGLAGSLGLGRYVRSALYGVSPVDSTVLASVTVILALVSLLASLLPAIRAARVDPVVALRQG
jgi:putative ABC transport system permease protein